MKHARAAKGTARPPLERIVISWQMIRAGKFPNATVLADRLEVSTRTVRKDLEFMRERMGFTFDYDATRRGYAPTAGGCRCVFCGGQG